MKYNSLTKLFIALLIFVHAAFKSEAICDMSMDQLNECKPSVSGSNPTDPSAECCTALAGADLECLCSYRNSSLLPSFGIDPDLAMHLPQKCGLTPPQDCS